MNLNKFIIYQRKYTKENVESNPIKLANINGQPKGVCRR